MIIILSLSHHLVISGGFSMDPVIFEFLKALAPESTLLMKEASAGETDISRPFKLFEPESISHVRTEEIDGGKACVFRGLPEKSDRKKTFFSPAQIELWIGADDGVIRKMVFLNEEGTEIMSQSYTNIQLNVEAADSQFEFTPPEGVQVADMTEGTVNMMREMKGEAE